MKTETLVSELDYLESQIQPDAQKAEYYAGQTVAMAGASDTHVLIVTNLVFELGLCLKKTPCRIYSSDRLLYVPACDSYFYPDLMLLCKPPELRKRSPKVDALLNPEVIIEVLSDSTRGNDLSKKFHCYQTIPSLRQYVVVEQDIQRVDSFLRQENNDWLLRSFDDPESEIPIGQCKVPLAEIYDKV